MMSRPSQVEFIKNNKIRTAVPGLPFYGKAPVADPSDKLIGPLIAGLHSHYAQCLSLRAASAGLPPS